ncbi:MAG: chorismate mutase [Bacteroidota bacterium]
MKKNFSDSKNWFNQFDSNKPLIIAGPCSAETEDQVMEIARELVKSNIGIMRAGVWKPRTRPGNFEGVGAIGLEWLQKAKKETGILLATEVANKTHVELALEANIDVLWIGARSTVSPFIVQEIADALQGTDKIVLVKNPVNPDLQLWLGAVERLYDAGITKLGVIHRGFTTYEKSKYRNNPEWQIPIDLKSRFPELPIFVDPSHISGNRELIADICQTALDLNYHGIMVETHPTPEKAWSDANQQVSPETLRSILENLQVRKTDWTEKNYLQKLSLMRDKIDVVDKQITDAIGKRMQIVDEIGHLKGKYNVAILQEERWNQVLKNMLLHGNENQLTDEFVTQLFKAIHQESITHQHKIINKSNK